MGGTTFISPPGIYSFRGEYRFLSNFYIEPDGTHVEGEYQRAKCAEAQQRKLFHHFEDDTKPLHPPDMCRFIGRTKITVRPDWEQEAESGLLVKVSVMLFYVQKKFRDHPSLAAQLLRTRPWYLCERNGWGDRFWGIDEQGRGLNMLGAILMQVRDGL